MEPLWKPKRKYIHQYSKEWQMWEALRGMKVFTSSVFWETWMLSTSRLLVAVVIGMERWARPSEGVWRYKIREKRMCVLSQLKSCQGAGAYKLQARDKRQHCLSSCFPLHLCCPFSPLLSSLFFSLLHHCTSVNQAGNGKAVYLEILTLWHVKCHFLPQ